MEPSDKQKELTSRYVVKLEHQKMELLAFCYTNLLHLLLLSKVKYVRQKWENTTFSPVNYLYFFPIEESALFPVVVRKWEKIVQLTNV